jgi:hypothetical protein
MALEQVPPGQRILFDVREIWILHTYKECLHCPIHRLDVKDGVDETPFGRLQGGACSKDH